ncbi:chromate transporter [Pandoraea bronchicola]|uniref:Chromate transporter n=1 Tax=Pandoraea bronchicola TaxID=2508287 RepID=A0A5E5BTJ7_9BURK|nr:chromate transporter [Pandoraea bronchicola]VVE88637.1 chromate transporter [Pandoraea bronchicola]
MNTLVDLFLHGSLWSLLAVGGTNVTLADIYRYAVETRHWITDAQFVTFFSLAQAAPGPNGMAVTLIGLQAAGLPGALTATLAKCAPSSLLAYLVGGWVDRHERSPWVRAVRAGLAPITVGLLAASSAVVAREVDVNVARGLVTLAAVVITLRTRWNPLWLIATGSLLGLTGWLM